MKRVATQIHVPVLFVFMHGNAGGQSLEKHLNRNHYMFIAYKSENDVEERHISARLR